MRLIDADDLIYLSFDDGYGNKAFSFVPGEFIENAPTVDAVPVTRCKHCRKWLNGDDTYGTCQWNEYQTLQTRYDDYCSHAERND